MVGTKLPSPIAALSILQSNCLGWKVAMHLLVVVLTVCIGLLNSPEGACSVVVLVKGYWLTQAALGPLVLHAF